jgi:hypothetical protein
MSGQGAVQDRQLAMGLETEKAFGGLQHGRRRPAQTHRGVAPVLHVAADTSDRPVHVLDDIGAGQRTAQFGGQAEAIDDENFVEALQNAVPDARCVVFQAAGKIANQPFGLLRVVQFPGLAQRPAPYAPGSAE